MLRSIHMPDGEAGIAFGFGGILAPHHLVDGVTTAHIKGSETDRETGFEQNGLHNELLFTNQGTFGQGTSTPGIGDVPPPQINLGSTMIRLLPPTAIPFSPNLIPIWDQDSRRGSSMLLWMPVDPPNPL